MLQHYNILHPPYEWIIKNQTNVAHIHGEYHRYTQKDHEGTQLFGSNLDLKVELNRCESSVVRSPRRIDSSGGISVLLLGWNEKATAFAMPL